MGSLATLVFIGLDPLGQKPVRIGSLVAAAATMILLPSSSSKNRPPKAIERCQISVQAQWPTGALLWLL